ncbi:hypothetical protein BDK51DRAFT_46350 [Blyttiomyces helicus]|uniref:Uncharacterized protein n=1 Tax=Blyttiomyces helicus TaxID=388810 RepID=A0A4P9WG03_9FUNG|nr:hypothetical protein BDK51DRAFT_46350 [Blyttiomyces helicus]|eukprot:RKO90723.1 hypothetical protein BDK51DRAFT_46350 [Blyttiomyces helicus]
MQFLQILLLELRLDLIIDDWVFVVVRCAPDVNLDQPLKLTLWRLRGEDERAVAINSDEKCKQRELSPLPAPIAFGTLWRVPGAPRGTGSAGGVLEEKGKEAQLVAQGTGSRGARPRERKETKTINPPLPIQTKQSPLQPHHRLLIISITIIMSLMHTPPGKKRASAAEKATASARKENAERRALEVKLAPSASPAAQEDEREPSEEEVDEMQAGQMDKEEDGDGSPHGPGDGQQPRTRKQWAAFNAQKGGPSGQTGDFPPLGGVTRATASHLDDNDEDEVTSPIIIDGANQDKAVSFRAHAKGVLAQGSVSPKQTPGPYAGNSRDDPLAYFQNMEND